jgi:hypothetical protein
MAHGLNVFQEIGERLINDTASLSPIPVGRGLSKAINDATKPRPDFDLTISGLAVILNAIGGNEFPDLVKRFVDAVTSLNPLKVIGVVLDFTPQLPSLVEGLVTRQIEVAASVFSILKAVAPGELDNTAKAIEKAYGDYFFGDGYETVPEKKIAPPDLPSANSTAAEAASFFSQKTGERYVRDLVRLGIEAVANDRWKLVTRYGAIDQTANIGDKAKAKKWFEGFANFAEASVTGAIEQALQGVAAFQTSPLIAASVATAAGTAARKAAQQTFLQEIGIPLVGRVPLFGRPLEMAPQVTVPEQIDRAIEKIRQHAATNPELPHQDSVLATLEKAREQAGRQGRDADLKGAIPDDFHVSLVLTAMNGSSLGPAPVRAMDLFGGSEYENLDPRWLKSLFNRLVSEPVPFPNHMTRKINPVLTLGNEIRIAIAGDWGTGNESSHKISRRMDDLAPHHTIHLGDVYYSGTHEEERKNFVGSWPPGRDPQAPSFALNGNHEMYSGGAGYFIDVLGSSEFKGQQGLSYFALMNDHWAIIGLDSAYHARDFLFQHGFIDEEIQLRWLREVGHMARSGGKRIIVLSHHQPIDLRSEERSTVFQQPLFDQVVDALEGGPDYWYWGHVHAGIAFEPVQTSKGRIVRGRCVGHGGVPYAPYPAAAEFGGAQVKVAWVETEKAGDPEEERRALNGFLLMTLAQGQITEEFRDENGNLRWRLSS